MSEPGSILVIRRDNIGDLVCTTPLLSALRTHFPNARIEVLANSYNAPVLAGNPHIDRVHAYRKLKHLGDDEGVIAALHARITMLWTLRRRKLDLIVVASDAQDYRAAKLARFMGPQRLICAERSGPGQHEVERTFTAARRLGIEGPIPHLCVIPDATRVLRVRHAMERAGHERTCKLIGLHISARRPMQRWPAERFAELVITLSERHHASILLFWSPGEVGHTQHPGDNEKAGSIRRLVADKARLVPWPTAGLSDLTSGLAACDIVVCSDGGAMHIAAGLGKPIVCFFGDSDVERWRPWGVNHIVLKAQSCRVEDIAVQDVYEAAAASLHIQAKLMKDSDTI